MTTPRNQAIQQSPQEPNAVAHVTATQKTDARDVALRERDKRVRRPQIQPDLKGCGLSRSRSAAEEGGSATGCGQCGLHPNQCPVCGEGLVPDRVCVAGCGYHEGEEDE